jgi:hypothetical protein
MFITVPLLRGFTEIRPVFGLAQAHGAVICGGYARYCASLRRVPEKPGDVDLFPQSDKAHEGLLAELLDIGYMVQHENDVSITMRNPDPATLKDIRWAYTPTIQIIKPVIEGAIVTVGTVEDILNNFDFTVVRAAILDEDSVLVDENFVGDERHKQLVFKNIHCPVSSMIRAMKYAKKGYYMKPSESMKLFADWDERTDDYRSRIIDLFKQSAFGEMSEQEVHELESLLRID